jgi:hypothetical protein
MGEFFQVLELEISIKSSEKIMQLANFSRQKDETLKMLYKSFSSSKKILRPLQTWKLPIGIFIRWKVFQHSMHRFCNEVL